MRIKGCFLIFQAATQCSSDAVSFKNLVKGREWTMKMDMEDADMTLWTEADFEEKCTYIVNDHPWDPSADGGTLTQAEASLPRNLTFKYASNCKEVSGNALGKVGVRRAKSQRFGKRALTPVPLFNARTHAPAPPNAAHQLFRQDPHIAFKNLQSGHLSCSMLTGTRSQPVPQAGSVPIRKQLNFHTI